MHRLLYGAGVDQMEILINGDYHEFHFSGVAKDVLDSSSFETGAGATDELPGGTALDTFDYSIVPGHMGQAWLGDIANAVLHDHERHNHSEKRARDTEQGVRPVDLDGDFTGAAHGDGGLRPLRAGRRRHQGTVPGGAAAIADQRDVPARRERPGSVMGVYLKSVVPEVPEFDDGQNRLQWKLPRVAGTGDIGR